MSDYLRKEYEWLSIQVDNARLTAAIAADAADLAYDAWLKAKLVRDRADNALNTLNRRLDALKLAQELIE